MLLYELKNARNITVETNNVKSVTPLMKNSENVAVLTNNIRMLLIILKNDNIIE